MDKFRGGFSAAYPSAASRIMIIELFLRNCGLGNREYQYLSWTFDELLEDVSMKLVGSKFITDAQLDRALLIDLAQIIKRMRPILPGIEAPKG